MAVLCIQDPKLRQGHAVFEKTFWYWINREEFAQYRSEEHYLR